MPCERKLGIRFWCLLCCALGAALLLHPIFDVGEATIFWWVTSIAAGVGVTVIGMVTVVRIGHNNSGYWISLLAAYVAGGWMLIATADGFAKPQYVGVTLGHSDGQRRSQVYRIGSAGANRNVKPDRGNDSYRTVRYFLHWQSAVLVGFKPNTTDIPEADGTIWPQWLVPALVERILHVGPVWIVLCLGLALVMWFRPQWYRD